MNINWYGQSCFQITSSQEKNNRVNIVIDPFSNEIGLRLPKLEADIVLLTHDHQDHNNVKAVSGNPLTGSGQAPFLISGPGEYEVKNVYIEGIDSWHDDKEGKERGENTIYTIETEELKLCHLGDFGQKELLAEQIDKIGQIDILMIPVGGVFTISAKEAIKIMSQIEPSIIIPMHYQLPRLRIHRADKKDLSVLVKLDSLDQFLKAIGIKKIDPLAKLTIKKKDIIPEEARIVVLSP